MNCPRCQNPEHVKDGIIQGKQRYRCRRCSYHFTPKLNVNKYVFIDEKEIAKEMYQAGMSLRSIAKKLSISHASVYNWIKGEKIDDMPISNKLRIVSRDLLMDYFRQEKFTEHKGIIVIDLEKNMSFYTDFGE